MPVEAPPPPAKLINYNMRCIETLYKSNIMSAFHEINYNMRCIETSLGLCSGGKCNDKLQHEMY